MNRRQELADLLDTHHEYSTNDQVAAAVLEHLEAWKDLKGPDLDALAVEAVVMDDSGDVWQQRAAGVWCGYEVSDHTSTRLARFGPFRILYTGKEA